MRERGEREVCVFVCVCGGGSSQEKWKGERGKKKRWAEKENLGVNKERLMKEKKNYVLITPQFSLQNTVEVYGP